MSYEKHLDPNAYWLLLLRELNALAVLAPNQIKQQEDSTSKAKGASASSAYAKKRNEDAKSAAPPPPPYHPERSTVDLLRGPWVAALPSYVKAIFHSALDWSWLQQQQPATGLLLDLSRSSQDYAVNAYHQIRSRLVDASPHLFPPRLYSLVRFSHAYTLVNSRWWPLQTRAKGVRSSAAAEGSSEKDKGAEVVDSPASESTVFPIIVPVADFSPITGMLGAECRRK